MRLIDYIYFSVAEFVTGRHGVTNPPCATVFPLFSFPENNGKGEDARREAVN